MADLDTKAEITSTEDESIPEVWAKKTLEREAEYSKKSGVARTPLEIAKWIASTVQSMDKLVALYNLTFDMAQKGEIPEDQTININEIKRLIQQNSLRTYEDNYTRDYRGTLLERTDKPKDLNVYFKKLKVPEAVTPKVQKAA